MVARIETDKQGHTGFIVFDHQARRNAMTSEMWRAVPAIVDAFARDTDVRVVVMRGAGEVAFVAGADISEFERVRSGDVAEDYDADNRRAFAALSGLEKPLVAMVHGFCIGGGCALALTADLRYSADDGRFGIPAARLGLGYQMAGIETLMHAVGLSNAKELFFRAGRFSAEEALRMGLLNGVFPKADLEASVLAIAEEIGQNAPLTIRAAKIATQEILRPAAKRDRSRVDAAIRACYASADYKEGVAAFLGKRRARFQGQ
ncbi:MAG: enoyl-CoA hydratase [Myxococcales bacterium]|nr:enoyl-CoA hydratase [Myxococcales bacterium]